MENVVRERLKSVPPPIWGLVAATLAIFVLMRPALFRALEDPFLRDQHLVAMVRVPPGSSARPFDLQGNWKVDGKFASPQGDDTRAVVLAEPGPWDQVLLKINARPGQPWFLKIDHGVNSTTLFNVEPGKWLRDEMSGVDSETTSPMVFALETAFPPEDAPRLESIDIRLGARALNATPNLAGIVALAFLPAAITLLMMLGPGWMLPRAATLGAGIGLAGALFVRGSEPALDVVSAFALLVALAAFAAAMRRLFLRAKTEEPLPNVQLLAECAVVCLLIVAAWSTRSLVLSDSRRLELRPDAAGYVHIAREGTFYQTALPTAPWVREPLFPALIRAAWIALPKTETSARFAGVLISIGVVVMTYLVGRRLVPRGVAAFAAGIIAMNRPLAELGTEALRNDAITFAVLLFVLLTSVLAQRAYWRAAAGGVLAAAMALLQISLLPVGVIALAVEGVRSRWHWREWLLAAAPMVLLLPGHLAFNAKISGGDFMYSSTVHTRYFANQEFAGQPGFPAPEDLAADRYAGEPMTTFEYFALFSPMELVARGVRGMADGLVTGMTRNVLFAGPWWIMLPGLLGGIWWFADRKRWWLAFVCLLVLAPIALVGGGRADWRLSSTLAPWIAMIWASGFWAVWDLWKRRPTKGAVEKQETESDGATS